METVCFSETSVSTYESTRYHNPEEEHQHLLLRENLKSHNITVIFKPWRWRQYVSPKRWYLPTNLHGITTQKKNINIYTSVRTSNLTILVIFKPCRWRQYVSPKRRYLPTNPHGITTQKKNINIYTSVRTSDLTILQLYLSPEDGDSMLLRNVGIYWQVYTASQPRRTTSITLNCPPSYPSPPPCTDTHDNCCS
jgi:hypothetical protein